MQKPLVRIKTTGGAGVAAGQEFTDFNGMLSDITVKFHASAPATTRVRVFLVINGIETEIVDRTNSAGSFNHFPTIPLMDKAGAEVSRAVPFGEFRLRINVSLSDALDEAVTVTVQ